MENPIIDEPDIHPLCATTGGDVQRMLGIDRNFQGPCEVVERACGQQRKLDAASYQNAGCGRDGAVAPRYRDSRRSGFDCVLNSSEKLIRRALPHVEAGIPFDRLVDGSSISSGHVYETGDAGDLRRGHRRIRKTRYTEPNAGAISTLPAEPSL